MPKGIRLYNHYQEILSCLNLLWLIIEKKKIRVNSFLRLSQKMTQRRKKMAEKNKTPMFSKKKAVQMPSKKTMNFARRQSNFNPKRVIPVILVIIIAVLVFTKFAIMDPMDKRAAAQAELSYKKVELASVNAQLANYDELASQYGRYSYGWMNETEVNMVSRMDVLHLVEEEIANKAFIDNLAVNNNVLTMNIHGITLEQASAMVKRLEEKSLVESASVYNAVAEDAEKAEIFMSIVLTKEAE